jgi:ureidoacrylate peracid hydrolase
MGEPFEDLESTIAPSHTALLIIDVQNDFCQDENRKAMIPRLRHLLEGARDCGVPVIYVQNTVLPNNLSDSPADLARRKKLGIKTTTTMEGTWGQQFVDEIKPIQHEPVVRKHRLSALTGTTLDTILRSRGIQTIICAGTATHGCVINTAYAAIALNYYVVVAEDCVASWRTDLHDAAIFLMRNTINHVVTGKELLSAWRALSKQTKVANSG